MILTREVVNEPRRQGYRIIDEDGNIVYQLVKDRAAGQIEVIDNWARAQRDTNAPPAQTKGKP